MSTQQNIPTPPRWFRVALPDGALVNRPTRHTGSDLVGYAGQNDVGDWYLAWVGPVDPRANPKYRQCPAEEQYHAPMSGVAIREARLQLGLDRGQFAFMLGEEGVNSNDQVFRLESEQRPMRQNTYRLLQLYLAGYQPPDWGSWGYGSAPTMPDVAVRVFIPAGVPVPVFDTSMTPYQLRHAQANLGLDNAQLAQMLGIDVAELMRMQDGTREIKPVVARLLAAYAAGIRPPDWPRTAASGRQEVICG